VGWERGYNLGGCQILSLWKEFTRTTPRDVTPTHIFLTIAGVLCKKTARRLVIDSPFPGLPTTYWWDLLEGLPGIEELELLSASVTALGVAWK